MRGYRHKSITRRHNDDESKKPRRAQTNGTKERISNRLGRENGEDQSQVMSHQRMILLRTSDDREPNDEEDDRGYERNFGSSSTWIGIAL